MSMSPTRLAKHLGIRVKYVTHFLRSEGIIVKTERSDRELADWFVDAGYGFNNVTSNGKIRRVITEEGVNYIESLVLCYTH